MGTLLSHNYSCRVSVIEVVADSLAAEGLPHPAAPANFAGAWSAISYVKSDLGFS